MSVPGNTNAVRHGGNSQRAIRTRAGYEKQRLLKRLGLVQSDLAPAGRYRLDQWAIPSAEVWLYEQWLDEHGLLDEEGSPPGFMATYYAARNTVSRRFRELERHLVAAAEAKHEGAPLHEYLRSEYGADNGG